EKVVELKREEADAVGFKEHPYDALVEEFEPGTTVAELKELFAGLTRDLVPLIRAIADSPKKPDRSGLEREYPVDRQKVFAAAAGRSGTTSSRGSRRRSRPRSTACRSTRSTSRSTTCGRRSSGWRRTRRRTTCTSRCASNWSWRYCPGT